MSTAFSDFHSRPQKHGLVIFNVPRELSTSELRLELLAFGGLEHFDRRDDATAGNDTKTTGTYSCKVAFFQRAAADAARSALNGAVRYGRKLRVERRNIAKGKRGLYAHKTCVALLNDELPLRWSTTIVDVSTGPVKPLSASGATGSSGAGAAGHSGRTGADSGAGAGTAGFAASSVAAFASAPLSMAAQGGRMLLHRTALRGLGPSSFPSKAGATAGAGAGMQQDGPPADAEVDGEDEDAGGEHDDEGGVFGARFVLRGEGRAGSGGGRFDNGDGDEGDGGHAASASAAGDAAIDARRSRWVKDGVGRRGGGDWGAAFASARFAAAGLPLRNALEGSRGAPPQCFRSGVVPVLVCGQLPPQVRGTGTGSDAGAGAGAGAAAAGAAIPGSSACAHVRVMLTLHGSDGFTDHVQGIGGCAGPATGANRGGGSAGTGAGAESTSSSAGGAATWRPCPSHRRMHRSKLSSGVDADGNASGSGSGDWPDQGLAPLRLHTGALIPGRYRDCFGSSGGLGSAAGGAGSDAVALAGPYESRRDDGGPRVGRSAPCIYGTVAVGGGFEGGDSDSDSEDEDEEQEDGDHGHDHGHDACAEPEYESAGTAAAFGQQGCAGADVDCPDPRHRPGPMQEDEDEVEGEAGLAEERRAVAAAGMLAEAKAGAAGMLADIGGSAAAAVDGVVAEAEAEAEADALETATTRVGEDAYGYGRDAHAGQATADDDASRSCASSCSGCRGEDEDGSDDAGSSSQCSDSDDDGAEAAYAAVLARARAAADFGHTFGVPLPMLLPLPTSAAAAAASDAGADGNDCAGLFDEDGAPLPPAPAPAPARPAVRFLSSREDMPVTAAGAGAHLPAAGIVDLSLQLEEVRHAIALEETYAANGNAAAAARLRELRGQQAKLAAHSDRRGMEAAWAARGYSCGDMAEGKHVRRASEMALRDACRQFMLRRPIPTAGAGAGAGAGFGVSAAYHCSEA